MRILLVVVGWLWVSGCGSEPSSSGGADSLTGIGSLSATGSGGGDGTGSSQEIFDVANDTAGTAGGDPNNCDAEDLIPTNAVLTGRVFAPNMEIPISGALVYIGNAPPEPVPDAVYCAECVALSCNDQFVLTEADGTFELPAIAGAGQKLVVQKGQFLRSVDFDVVEGDNVVPFDQTNLPGVWNPDAGMWIPRIAVYETDPDKVFNVLAKFGLGQVDAGGDLVPGTEQFTLIPDSDQGAFMDNLDGMNQYHIIFVPCAATKFWIGAPGVPAARAENIRAYVAAGGKWYATDHSNEYIKEPFAPYMDFHNAAMPDLQPAYDVTGTVQDPDMLAWLEALPPELKDIGGGNPTLNQLPSVELRLNYSGIDATHDIIVQDNDGNDVNVGPYTWVAGPCSSCSDPATFRPMAVTGQFGCGRIMYSTFENSSVAHNGLNPQELMLLYMILEIGVCHDTPPPAPPPVG